jgi:ABC-2 type transport system permease protein
MTGAFFYLTICSLRNRVRVKLKRLREPRYAIGLVVGVLYLYNFAFRNAFRGGGRPGRITGSIISLLVKYPGPVTTIVSLLLFAAAAAVWLLPGFKPPLTFSRAEVQFLFPAPLARRQLVHFKLIRTEAATLFTSAIMTLFFRPPSVASGFIFFAGLWLLLSIARLHAMGISLSRESLARRPVAGFASMWLAVAVALGAIGVLGATVAMDWARLASFATPREVFHEIDTLMSTGAGGIVLWPFRAIVRVPLAQTAAEFRSVLPAALAIMAANYAWVVRADTSFEEASAEQAEKAVTRLASREAPPRVKAQATPTPFTLSPAGPPELAILWKNLIMLGRYASLKTLIRIVPLLLVFGMLSQRRGQAGGVLTAIAILCLFGTVMTILMGPMMARNDLRQDLGILAVLKAWPISGATLLRGELLAPMALLTAIVWLLILGALTLSGQIPVGGRVMQTIMLHRVSYALAAMLAAPALILAQLVVQNGIAITFPAWVSIGAARPKGIDVMGQRLIMMAGNLIVLVLFILPGALAAGLVSFAVYSITHSAIIVVPALTVALVMIVECWLAVEALGRILDRTDVNAVDARE